ncbi:MAG: hypothetical protein JW759_05190 [Candidatus Coatesbacteria bacterium]|nr:hypothetical protein [Candidatus Coatesbacteria bacterium]
MKGILIWGLVLSVSCGFSGGVAISEILSYPFSWAPGTYIACAYGRAWVPTDGALISVDPSTGDLKWFALRDGLGAQNPITLVRDALGYLWLESYVDVIGEPETDGRVCLFDGLSSSCLDTGYPSGVTAGQDGSVWAMDGYRVLLCWNAGQPDEWTSYDLREFGMSLSTYPSPRFCVDREGHVWLKSSRTLFEFQRDALIAYDMPDDIRPTYDPGMTADASGRIWFVKNDWDYSLDEGIGRIGCYDHGEWSSFSGEALGIQGFSSLAEAPDGTLLAGSDRGLFLYDGHRLSRLGTEDGLPFDCVRDVTVDPEGNLWLWCVPTPLGNALGALAKLDGAGIQVYPIEPHPLTSHGWPNAVDSEGRVWFVSEKNGLSSLFQGDWEAIPVDPETSGWPLRVSDDGAIWWSGSSGDDGGIWRYSDGAAQFFNDDDGLLLDDCWDLEIDSKGVVWAVGSAPGYPYSRQYISWFDGSKWKNCDDLVGMNDYWDYNYYDLAIDLDDSVWCAVGFREAETTAGGWACHWTRSEVTYYVPPVTGRFGPRLGAVAVAPDGTKWFLKLWQDPGYGDDPRTGLVRFDGSDWVWKWDDEFRAAVNPPLYVDHFGKLWMSFSVGQDSGLLLYDPETDTYRKYGVADGLGSTHVALVLMDADENVWINGDGAVSILFADGNIELRAGTNEGHYSAGQTMAGSLSWLYRGPSMPADLYTAIQIPSGQVFYVAPQGAEPAFPIFYAAFDGSTEFLKPGPSYEGPGSMPNTPDMKDLASPALPLPDPPAGQGPTGLALFAYPVPYFANVPLPAYSSIEDLVLLSTTLPETAPTGTYTFHLGVTAPSSISNVYRTAAAAFEVSAD